nr:retrovirus-related Pol polyprotein from transposon TNT 1-94 [Tanacetum cinerariifolium]
MNNLPEKWLTFSQGLRNGNHTQTLDLDDIYGRFVYEDNLIQRRISNKILMMKLMKGCPKSQKDYKAEYKKLKAKIALLEANASTSQTPKTFQPKNKGLVAKTFDWDEEEVFDDEEVTQVKVPMALADDELTVRKNHARNGEWIDITMKKITILISMDEDVDRQNYLKYINIDLNEQIPHQKKKVLGGELFIESSSKMNEIENLFIPASIGYDQEMVPKTKDWVERLNLDNKIPNFNTGRILVPERASPSLEVMPLTFESHSPREKPGERIPKKDKTGSKPNKNRKRGEAGKIQKQLQSLEEEKLKKTQKEGSNLQNGPFQPKTDEGDDKPESQWTLDERRVVVQDYLLEKLLTFSQGLRNANHTQTLDLVDIYERFVAKDNLIQRRYSDTKKALITTPSITAISTAFFSNNVIQDFQGNSDDKVDERSSEDYLKNLDIEFHERLDEEEVSNDEDVTQVNVLMALADDELTVGKNHARNGEWIDITMKKVNIHLSVDEDADWQNYLKYINIDLKFVEEQRLNLLSKGENINEKWLTSSKKVSQCISEQTPHQKKKVLGGELFTESSSKINENENLFVPASMRYDQEMVSKTKDWVERLNPDSKLSNFNTRRILVLESQAVNESLESTKTLNTFESSKHSKAESL